MTTCLLPPPLSRLPLPPARVAWLQRYRADVGAASAD
jgi:hypothetical protein